MIYKTNIKGFTLIEILLVMTISIIFLLSMQNISFFKTKDKENMELFKNNIVTKYETIRNFALTWRGIWINLDTPNSWRIDFSTWANILTTTYLSWTTWNNFNETNFIDNDPKKKILSINCLKIDSSTTSNLNISTWSIIFRWDILTLSWWCTDVLAKKIQLIYRVGTLIKTWSINTVNWLYEEL